MKKCPVCGNITQDADTYCNKCGYNFEQQYQSPNNCNNPVSSRLTKYYVFSVLEMMCFNFLFGGIGLFFTILAGCAYGDGDIFKYETNKKRAKIALILGVIFGILFFIIGTITGILSGIVGFVFH